MGKKKSGGSSGKKKKGGKKKKEDQLTWKEALLIYKISIKEKQMEDVRYELRALEEKNERHKERNDRLKEEQIHYIKLLLKQANEFESKIGQRDETDKTEVISVMKDKWKASRNEEKDIANLKEQIARTESHMIKENRQVTYWNEYKDVGCHDHRKQIDLLERELADMQTSYDEMAGHLERTLNKAKTEIAEYTESKLDKQKYLATEKAIAKMDKYSRQEVQDNDWLKREVEIHKEVVDGMFAECEAREQDNLKVMSELFECTVDDLKICRDFFLTQFNDDEVNLEENTVLQVDLAKLSVNEKANAVVAAPEATGRPKSAVLTAIEKRMRALEAEHARQHGTDDVDDALDEESQFDGENGPEDDQEDPFRNYFPFDDDEFENYLQLGPLELKLLNVKGHAMNIYKPATPADDELKAKDFKPDEWPVTAPMMLDSFR